MPTSVNVQVRPETGSDIPAIHAVNAAAFETPSEAGLVDRLRRVAEPFISYVATLDGAIVGHVLFTRVTITGDDGEIEAIGLAPLAVLPEHQKSGIGTALTEAGLDACRDAGFGSVVVLGHPDYYPRFGFRRASTWGLRYEVPVPDEAMMALELREGALDGGGGVIRYHPEFSK